MRSLRVVGGLVVAVGLILAGCSTGPDVWGPQPGPRVLAYFPPLYSLAASVAGPDAQVRSLITHVGPHHFEPAARDARALAKADLFLTIGLGLDDGVAKKLASSAGNKSLKLLALGESLPKTSLREGGCSCGHAHAAGEKHEDGEHHVEYDPHVWLGVPEAMLMVTAIRDQLVMIDPAHSEGYAARAAETSAKLAKLQADGQAMLAAKKEKPKVISFHDSMFYFARSFGIEVVDSIEAPGQEPSPQKLKKLVEACQKHGVRLIAVEPQYPSNTSARVLLEELKRAGIDAAFVELDPLETADANELTADYYERKTRENLANLLRALK